MISRKDLGSAKILAGVALAMLASLHYAAAFAPVHPVLVAGGMGLCFGLLTLPVWLALAEKPLSNVPAYYLLVLVVLIGLTLGRFPVQALFLP